jgi:hypothetical protein
MEECFSRGWIQILLERRSTDAIILLPREVDEDEMGIPESPAPGDSFAWRGSKILGTLEMLGNLEKKKIYDEVLVTEDEYERVVRLVNGRSRPLYRYTFVEVPEYWDQLLLLLPSDLPDLAGVAFDDDMDM